MTSRNSAVLPECSAGCQRYRIHIPVRIGIAVIMACLILWKPAAAADGVRCGLALCARSVMPSLFPFLVLSPMLADGIRRMIGWVCRGRLDARAAALLSAYTVGMLAGFPIGALSVLSLYGQGRIRREDAARFLGVCTGASPAFLVGYFGQSLWDNAALGWAAWILQCLLCLSGFLYLLCKGESAPAMTVIPPDDATPTLAHCLSEAVPRMLQICGCVVLFSVLRAFLCRWFAVGTAGLLGGFAEMTGGLCDTAALYTKGLMERSAAMIVSAAVIGFGGGCVGMQIADTAAGAGISMRQYWGQRILLGAAGALLAAGLGFIGYGIG